MNSTTDTKLSHAIRHLAKSNLPQPSRMGAMDFTWEVFAPDGTHTATVVAHRGFIKTFNHRIAGRAERRSIELAQRAARAWNIATELAV